MRFSLEEREGHLHAVLTGRDSAGEMRQFLFAVHDACRRSGLSKILVCVRRSRAVFKPEDYGIGGYAERLADPACQIAMVGDTPELNAAHEYIEVVARQRNLNVRAFGTEAAALRWLQAAPEPARRYQFTRIVLLGSPEDAGVYALWEGDELIYYGRAMGGGTTIRSCLLEHFEGRRALAARTTHYSWEISADPTAREAELLREYERMFGRLPRCNAGG